MADVIEKLFLLAMGLSVFGGSLAIVLWRNAIDWRYLAGIYPSLRSRAIEARHMQNAVSYGVGGASRSYNGILTIERHDTGVALRILPPFSIFHAPIFIPFTDIIGWNQQWYLNSKSVEIEFLRAPNVKFVMPLSQIEWLYEGSKGQFELTDKCSPYQQRPVIWYTIIIAMGILTAILAAAVLYSQWAR